MFYSPPKFNRNKSAYKPKSAQQFMSSQRMQSPEQIFQQKINLLENKVSDFLLEYLKTFYSSNIHAEEDLTRTLLRVQMHQQNGKIDIKPKFYIIPQHQQTTVYNLRLLQHFQLFIIKENKDNIFHYLKFLKGKADRKQCKSIKDTLYHINDFFISFTNQVKNFILAQQNSNPQFDYFVLQQFLSSQNFYNIQVLIITRILMKIFLMKFIRDLQQSKRSVDKKSNEDSLITLMEFYKIIKDDLREIEDIAQSSQQLLGFVNPAFFKVNKQDEKIFRDHVEQELNSEQLKSNYYQKLFGPQIQCKYLSFQGLTQVLEVIRDSYAQKFECGQELTTILLQKPKQPTTNTARVQFKKQFSFVIREKPTYSQNTSMETQETDEDVKNLQSQSSQNFHSLQEDLFCSESESSDDHEQDQNCQDNGGAFFENFYFDLLAQEIKVEA